MRRFIRPACLGVMLSSTIFSSANAQSATEEATASEENAVMLEEIVVTGHMTNFGATKSDIPILETSRSVSVITAEDFIEKGALTLDDTLNYTAGVVGDTFGFSTRGDFAKVRGLDAPEYLDNVQVLFGFYNNARSELYTLEQVEVLKGPASVLYGQGTPGGILNAVSKRAGSDNIGSEVELSYGTHDRMQAAADVGFSITEDGSLTGRLVALVRDSDTQVDFVKDDSKVFMPSLTYESEDTTLTLLVNYTDRESDTSHQFLPLAVTGCASGSVSISEANVCANAPGRELDSSAYHGDPSFNRYNTESLSVTLFAEHELSDIFTLEATARYRDNEADYRQTWISFLGDGTPRVGADGTAAGRSWYDAPAGTDQFAVDARVRAEFEASGTDHEMLFGVNYQDIDSYINGAFLYAQPTTFNAFAPDYSGSEVPASALFEAARTRSTSEIEMLGFYLNDQVEFGDFVANLGVRYDRVDNRSATGVQSDSAVSTGLGLLYKTEYDINPYFSYAQSFNPVVGTDGVTGNPLKPQEGEQFEIGIKYQPEGTRTYVTLSAFEITQTNLPNPAALVGVSQQEGEAEVTGIELEGQTSVGEFHFDAAISFLDTQDANDIKFASIPQQQASLWVKWRPEEGALENLELGAGVRYAGENESKGTAFLASNGFAPSVNTVTTDGYTVFDALIAYQIGDANIQLNARNLFDEEYYGTCLSRGDCFPGERRTVTLTTKYTF